MRKAQAVVEEAARGRLETLAFDREHLWHPYTSMTEPAPVRLVTSARGCELEVDGRWVVDGMSSWWAAIHGYRHPVLDAAVRDQVERFSHVMFGGLTHEPAVTLGRRLVDVTPAGLERVFLADSGSVSVEVAVKMALQYQRGIGRPERRKLLTVRGGYHGDTFHPMSVTDPDGGMHTMWSGLLPEQVFAQVPPRAGAGTGHLESWTLALERQVVHHRDELAAIIVEPLLQGAGGMRHYDSECLRVMRDLADEHGLLLIFDEIATGFGRTGHLFVSELVTPDILCLGKALTGGYLSLAAVLTKDAVARGISGSESGVVMHGPTFMGNPMACAVATASIDLLLASDWPSRVASINERLATGLEQLQELPGVKDVRTVGAVGVVQLDHPVDVVAATDAAVAAGVWLRPFRDLIYTMPPYVIADEELDRLLHGITEAVKAG